MARALGLIGWLGHARPGRRFLGNRQKSRLAAIDRLIHRAQEFHRFPILAPALVIGYPFAALARIIAVQHRGHRIDAQPINMISLGPEHRIVDQERGDLAPPEIIDRGVPVGVKTQPRIVMFIQRRAVKARQTMRVDREMRRHPIDQHADPGPMCPIDKAGKALRPAKPRAGGEQADRLIAPAGVIGIFGYGQEFDVGKAHLDNIGDQPFGHRVPCQKPAIVIALPRSGMHLIDADRHAARVDAGPMRAVVVIAPVELDRMRRDRRGGRAHFAGKAERVGLQRQHPAILGHDAIFIRVAWPDVGDEDFPHTNVRAAPHRRATVVPMVEIADQAHQPGIRRPDREMDAAGPFVRDAMRAQLVEQPVMRPLRDQVIVQRPQYRAKAVRIGHPPLRTKPARAIFDRLPCARNRPFEQAALINPRQCSQRFAAQRKRLGHLRPRQHRPGKTSRRPIMHPQQSKGVGMNAVE